MRLLQDDVEFVAETGLYASAESVKHSGGDVSSAEVNCETLVVVRFRSVLSVCYGCYNAFCVVELGVD